MEMPMLVYDWAAVTASQRREKLNPSKSSKRAYKQISGGKRGHSRFQISVFVATKGRCFKGTVKVQWWKRRDASMPSGMRSFFNLTSSSFTISANKQQKSKTLVFFCFFF